MLAPSDSVHVNVLASSARCVAPLLQETYIRVDLRVSSEFRVACAVAVVNDTEKVPEGAV